jgi:hypothetical protein
LPSGERALPSFFAAELSATSSQHFTRDVMLIMSATCMALAFNHLDAAAFACDLDAVCDVALEEPIAVVHDGHADLVLLSCDAYRELALLDHVAIASADMSTDDLTSFRLAHGDPETIALNALLDDQGDGFIAN